MDQKMSERVDLLEQWIKESDNVVFFGGAGVSTESGIPVVVAQKQPMAGMANIFSLFDF